MEKDLQLTETLTVLRSELSKDISQLNNSVHGIIIHNKGRILNYNNTVESFFFKFKNEDFRGMDLCTILSPEIIDKRIIHTDETETFYLKKATISNNSGLPIEVQIVSMGIVYKESLYKALIFENLNDITHRIIQNKELIDNIFDNIFEFVNEIQSFKDKSDVLNSMFNHLGTMSQAEIISLSVFGASRKMILEEIRVLNPMYYELNELFRDLKFIEMEPSQDAQNAFMTCKLTEAPIDLEMLSFNKLSPVHINKIVNHLQVKKVLALGVKHNNELIATFSFIFNDIPDNIYKSAIELYASFLGQIINKFYFDNIQIEKNTEEIIRSSSFAMATTSEKQIFQQMNNNFLQLVKYNDPSELNGKSIREITDRIVFDNLLTNIYIRKKKISDYYISEFQDKDKNAINLLVFACPNYNENDFHGAIGIFIQTTDDTNEQSSLTTDNQFKDLKSIQAGIIVCDKNSKVISHNEFIENLGFNGSKTIDVWLNEYFLGKKINSTELIEMMIKENLYVINIKTSAVLNPVMLFRYTKHQTEYFIYLFKNNIQTATQKSACELADIIDYGIIMIDGNQGNIDYVNQYICNLTGYKETDLIGKPHYSIVEMDSLNYHLHTLHKKDVMELNINNNIEFDSLLITKDKKKIDVKLSIQKHIFFGKESYILGIKSKGLEKEKDETNNSRKKSNSGFISDLRTPLNSMIGLCQLSVDERDFNRKNEIIGLVLEQANKFNRIIDDLTYISKLESGTMQSTLKEIDVQTLMSHVVEKTQVRCNTELGKKIVLDSKINDTGLKINSDSNRIEHIFDILIDNAFRTQRNVKLTIGVIGTESSDEIEFFVSTVNLTRTELVNKITNLHNSYFPKDDTQFEMNYVLCKLLIESINGRFTIKTKHDLNHFSFFIPFRDSITSKPILSDPKRQVSGKKILILTSDESMKDQIINTWGKQDMHFDFSKGETKIIEELRKNEHDLLILDMEASDSKGIETLWLLKHKCIKTPVLAILSNSNNSLKEKCLKIGCSDYITKPLNETILIHKTNRIFSSILS